jgi:hypothetical protein
MSNAKTANKRSTQAVAAGPVPSQIQKEAGGEARDQSSVEYELTMLEAELYSISDCLNTLRHRVEPVLSQPRPMEDCCGIDSDTDCPLQQTIRDKRSIVSGHKELICDLLERIQL